MSEYSSCNQIAKDLANVIIVEKVFAYGSDIDRDCVVTTDAEHNGTSVECRKHFAGLISVPQLDPVAANAQEKRWKASHPEDRLRVVHPKHNICNDLPNLARQFWTKGKNVLLWNFDMFSTFYTYPVRLVETMCTIPQIVFSSDTGSVVAFTFAAIPHGGHLAKLKNCESWKDRVAQFHDMKKMQKNEIMTYYREAMDRVWEQKKLPCVKLERVEIDINRMQGEDRIYHEDNALLYEGSSVNESTMCVLLYRVWHDGECRVEHQMPPKEETASRKRTREMQQVEEDIIDEPYRTGDENRGTKRVRISGDGRDQDDSGFVEQDNMDLDSTVEGTDSMDEDESTYVVDIESEHSTASEDEDDSDISTVVSATDSDFSKNSGGTGGDSGYSTGTGETENLSDCELYPHQMDMMIAVRDNDRGYVNATCGCGKSLPMTRSCLEWKTSVIFVPFKVLVEQFYKKYFEDVTDIVVHKVNSEYMQDAPVPKDGETTIYLANYDSLHRLAKLGIVFDLIHWDEAHLATSEKRRGKIDKMDGEPNEALDMEDVVSIQAKKHVF